MDKKTINHNGKPDRPTLAVGDNAIGDKFADASTPGYQAEFDPEEAEQAGAFVEDALTEQDAVESGVDLADAL